MFPLKIFITGRCVVFLCLSSAVSICGSGWILWTFISHPFFCEIVKVLAIKNQLRVYQLFGVKLNILWFDRGYNWFFCHYLIVHVSIAIFIFSTFTKEHKKIYVVNQIFFYFKLFNFVNDQIHTLTYLDQLFKFLKLKHYCRCRFYHNYLKKIWL